MSGRGGSTHGDGPSRSPSAPPTSPRRERRAVPVVTLYSKPDCHLCVEARAVLSRVRADLDFELSELDITTDEGLHRTYFARIPVVSIDGEELFDYFVDEGVLRQRLQRIL
jgi:glutaredoxin